MVEKEEAGQIEISMRTIVIVLVVISIFTASIIGYHFLIKVEKQVCEKELVKTECYKVGCSAWGCSRGIVDCSSKNVDIREDIYEDKCEWVKR